jgi:NTP pyrophosphatase (non-canonical NTP hydrolase)
MPTNELYIDLTIGMVRDELEHAMDLWPPMQSAHEGYAVILEELDELWEEIKRNQNQRDLGKMRSEAIQVAAMAARFVADLLLEKARAK